MTALRFQMRVGLHCAPESRATHSIAQHIVEQHGGAINVESHVGRGSRFTVKLPLLATGS